MANILLTGLDREAVLSFSRKLHELGHSVDPRQDTDLIFASDDDVRCMGMLRASMLRGAETSKPVVVVSRLGGDENWLAALEAGAADYCAADIDTGSLGWIVNNALGRHCMAAA